MTHRSPVSSVVVVSAALLMGACGSDDTIATPATAEKLASSLITIDGYEGDWSVNVPPDAPEAAASGVVPDELLDMLPLELCDAANTESSHVLRSTR